LYHTEPQPAVRHDTDEVGSEDAANAAAMAAESESLSLECRADADRLRRLFAPDLREDGASGREIGYDGTAQRVAAQTDPNGEPITVENMRGWLLADGFVMVKFTSEHHGRQPTVCRCGAAPSHWQVFQHQGTITTR
jgi:hypothetical protein